jgi:nicotinamide riboside kinase
MTKVIAFSGTHSTGKSTLVKTLQEKLSALNISSIVIKEQARRVAKQGYPINQYTTFDTQARILASYIVSIQDARRFGTDFIIIDRHVADQVAYSLASLVMKAELKSEILNACMAIRHYFDVTFFVPCDHEVLPEFDGVRDVDLDYREEVEGIISDLHLAMRKEGRCGEYYLLPTTKDIEARIEVVLEKLGIKK